MAKDSISTQRGGIDLSSAFYGYPEVPFCEKCNNDGENCECCLAHGDPECEHRGCN